jgi:hypothetical protein
MKGRYWSNALFLDLFLKIFTDDLEKLFDIHLGINPLINILIIPLYSHTVYWKLYWCTVYQNIRHYFILYLQTKFKKKVSWCSVMFIYASNSEYEVTCFLYSIEDYFAWCICSFNLIYYSCHPGMQCNGTGDIVLSFVL